MSTLLRLEVFHQGELLKEIPWDGSTIWVGRGEDCGIRLDDRAISRKHAVIRQTENGMEFEKKSKFGEAKVDGKDVDQVTLHGGECLAFGEYEIRLKAFEPAVASARAPSASESELLPTASMLEESVPFESPSGFSDLQSAPGGATAVMDVTQDPGHHPDFSAGIETPGAVPVEEPFPAAVEEPFSAATPEIPTGTGAVSDSGQFQFSGQDTNGATKISKRDTGNTKQILEFGDAGDGGRVYEMADDEIAIGRAPNCHVILEDRKSSRKHVVILKKEKQWLLKDLGSANGTLVNGARVDEHILSSGDEIRIGDTHFRFKVVQADYEEKKADFLQVPPEQLPPAPAYQSDPAVAASPPPMILPFESFTPGHSPASGPVPVPDFSGVPEENRSLIQKGLDRFRSAPPRMQMIYTLLVIAVLYFGFYEEDEVVQKAKIQPSSIAKKEPGKKDDKKKKLPGPSFESLTPEQQAYIDSEYKISLEHFKNREYDSCLLELGKIFSIVQDYKEAREVEALAREKKRQLEAQEEERKRKEMERQAQLKIQALIDQAGLLMEQKKYDEAEAIFPEIELLQPENTMVANWRKRIQEENEALERAKEEAAKFEKRQKEIREEYKAALKTFEEKNYFGALDRFDALLTREGLPAGLVAQVKGDIRKVENAIAAERDPLIEKGKGFEKEEKYTEAYQAYYQASKVDPTDHEAPAGMNRIRGVLTSRAKGIYSEGVIAESFSDFDLAERKYREVLQVVPVDNEYFVKATIRVKKLMALKQLSGREEPKQ
ncbi:MAG: FHA domain-containing protein [Bdellovibrionales bacterium]|nr:FHA domain-containing protein [Bdellovibrionales bacterium]